MMKRLFAAIGALTMSAVMVLTGCGSSSSSSSGAAASSDEDKSLQKVLDSGKLMLGLDATFKPMGYTDENNEIVGFDIDCAEEVCKRLGIKLEKVGINWDTKELDLDAGKIDCIWNGLSVSDERKKVMLMSDAYMENKMVFVVKKDSEINKLSDLEGKKVAVQNGSTADNILNESDIGKKITKSAMQTNVEALNQLDLGMCDAVFLDSVVAEYEITTSGKALRVLEEGLEPEQYAIGFRLKDKALCDKIYATLQEMKKDGKLAEISAKWFGKDVTTVK